MPRKAAAPALQAGTPAQAISPGGILHSAFSGPTWPRWIAVLRAAWGEKLSPEENRLFGEVSDRDAPTAQIKELWCIIGRGGGKDSAASAVACVAALRDYRRWLRPGERATVLVIACDRQQAEIARRYTTAYFTENPLLRPLVSRETADGIELTNGVEIIVATNSFRAVRGRTVVCAILDEVAFYSSEGSASPDFEVYAALQPALTRVPGSILIGISSAYKKSGLLYSVWQQFYGKPDPNVLVVRGATRQFNETYPQSLIDAEIERDAERAMSERMSEWRSDLSDYLDRELVMSVVDDVTVRPPVPGVEYRMFVDASGGRGDSFAAAVAHAEGDQAIIDCVYEARAPFNAMTVVGEVAELAKSYHVSTIEGDDYAAGILSSMVASNGIYYERTKRDKSQLYLEMLPLFTSGRARLIDNRRAIHQLVSLERRTVASGRDRISHPAGANDDLANVIAGALVAVASEGRQQLVRARALLEGGQGVPVPKRPAGVNALVYTDGDMAATVISSWDEVRKPPIVIIDFALEKLTPDTVYTAWQVGCHWSTECDAAQRGRLYAPPGIQEQNDDSEKIPRGWLSDLVALRVACGSVIGGDKVKLSEIAAEKAARTAFAGSLESLMRQPDVLGMAFMLGVVLTAGMRAPD
jgi:hypothetical protein